MTARDSAAERRTSRAVSSTTIESLLRAKSHTSRLAPPPQLRRQILVGLRANPRSREVRSFFDRWRASVSATAALASLMLLLALIASMVRLNQSHVSDTAAAHSTPWSALAQVTAPLGEEFRRPVPNPLIREARLIMQDARQTVTLLQRQLPLAPRFSQPTSTSHGEVLIPAVDGV